VARLGAWLFDALLQSLVLMVVVLFPAAAGRVGSGLAYLLSFAVVWLYSVAFELLWAGATPGKKLLGLQVVRANGLPVDAAASLIRNLLRAADSLPFLPLTALVTMLATRGFRRLGDLAAGTLVVYRVRSAPVWQAAARGGLRAVAPAAALTPAEQRTIVRFAGRAPFLGAGRAKEIAGPVAGLLDPRPEALNDPVGSLAALAAWITGQRGGPA
jgi:uncharacterized RDD family membrane protein YckC